MNQLPNSHSFVPPDRWEQLKPVIERLYLNEKKKLSDVVEILKKDYGFDAV